MARDIVLYNVFKFINLEIIYGTISKSSATRTASEYDISLSDTNGHYHYSDTMKKDINIIENATVIILPP